MALVGYARASSRDQSLDVQLEKLAHCDRIFAEKGSGTLNTRPELTHCMGYVREGDTLYVTKLDRLARSTLHLCSIVAELERKRVGLQVIDQAIDTVTPTGRLLLHMLAAIAEFETAIRKERQLEGIALARRNGTLPTTPLKLDDSARADLIKGWSEGQSAPALAQRFGISCRSVYRYLDRAGVRLADPTA